MPTPTRFTCPYLGEEVEDEMTLEHIFSDSLGCPDNFGIQVSKRANGLINQKFEERFIRSSHIAQLRQEYHLKGRRGVPDWLVQGTILDGRAQARAVRRPDGSIHERFFGAVLSDGPNTGLITYAPERPEDVERLRQRLVQENPGKTVIVEEDEHILQNVPITQDQPLAPHAAQFCFLAKIGFAGLLHRFPQYTNDPEAKRWRDLLFGVDRRGASDDLSSSPTRIKVSAEYLDALVPDLQRHEHTWCIYADWNGSKVYVVVGLFGGCYKIGFLASESSTYELSPGEGISVRCDATSETVTWNTITAHPDATMGVEDEAVVESLTRQERAYFRWLDRGCPEGDDLSDWFAT